MLSYPLPTSVINLFIITRRFKKSRDGNRARIVLATENDMGSLFYVLVSCKFSHSVRARFYSVRVFFEVLAP
jgi:hypothetical protein